MTAAAHYLLRYDLAPDYLARRDELRAAHLALAWEAAGTGALMLGGAVGDPIDSALLLFRDYASAEAFAQADPYVAEGLVTSWRISPWHTVVGADAATPIRPGAGL
ncbi:YciI-like protein [Sphingomonas mucosissima]|uniref:YciI-like protein n=1 Tax=Sphingomonas mucosissima TaxID=370959 RepID=A0A245ZR00_9SPHN|nr:YciI-like protein [Sphingomonas mucosissima]OWK32174.1 YciI-like protein [Sphingomonas mucosissima]